MTVAARKTLDSIGADKEINKASTDNLAKSEERAYELYMEELKATSKIRENCQNLGYLGRFFGSKGNAVANITGLIAISSFLVLIPIVFFHTGSPEDRKFLIQTIVGILGMAFGFLAGKTSR